MKKKNSLLFILLMYSLTMLAQKDITKFMGIPVDGFKKDMIQKLKAKGFEYDNEIDLLTGEFNGEKVNIFVATQSNKVWRIVVADAIERNEHDIKIRFNNLYDQFNDNPKYVPKLEDNDYISEDINLAYEMKVRNKRFEAGFMQMTNPKSPQNSPEKIQQELTQKISEICPAEEFIRKSEKEKEDITKEAAMNIVQEAAMRSVWFMISEKYGKFSLILFYDNEYNKLNSTCKCNRILINNLFKFFVWREVSKSFTRSIIEFIFNPLNLFVGYFTKVLTLWDILPDKPVGVFIGTTFP